MRLIDRVKGMFQTAPAPVPPLLRGLTQEVAYADPYRLFSDGTTQYNPSVLVTRQGLQVFDKMRQDDQVKAALAFKKHALLSSGWEVVSPKGQSEDWEVRMFVVDMLKSLDGTLYEALYAILSALDYGYSVTEKIFVEEENRLALKRLKTCKPHSFEFISDEYGNLTELRQSKTFSGYAFGQGQPLPMDKFILFSNQKEFGNHYGISDLEAAYRPWLIKDNSYKWLSMALERRGIPALFALYDAGKYHPAIIRDLKDVLTNLQASTVGVIPRTEKDSLEFYEPKTIADTKNIFTDCINMFNNDISRALLMPGLLGVTSDGAEGSYARSKVHFDVFIMLVNFLRQRLEDGVMFEQVIRPLVDLNFPGVRDYPIFRFLPISEDNQLDLLDKWVELTKVGAVGMTKEDEAHVRQIVKFPERQGVAAQTLKTKEYAMEFAAPDFKVIEEGLDEIEAWSGAALILLLKEARDALIKFVERNADNLPTLTQDIKLKGMGEVQSVIGEMLRRGYDLGYRAVKSEISGREEMQGAFTPTEALKYLNQKKLWVSGVLKDDVLNEVRAVLFNAVKTGELQAETRLKLYGVFEQYVGMEGVLKEPEKLITPYRLETIIRTNVTESLNHGRVTGAMEASKFLHGMRYSAVLDARTTEQCRALHGQIFAMDDPALLRFTPPLHFNCRSVLVPVPKSVQVKAGDFVSPALAGKVNGLVPASFGGSAGK